MSPPFLLIVHILCEGVRVPPVHVKLTGPDTYKTLERLRDTVNPTPPLLPNLRLVS